MSVALPSVSSPRSTPTVSVTVPATRAMRKRLLADFYKSRGLDLSEDARADFMRRKIAS